MSTATINIDENMYSLFLDESKNNCAILLSIFSNQSDKIPGQTELDNATQACSAINSAAILCSIPLIPAFAQAIEKTIQLIKNDKLKYSEDVSTVLTNSLMTLSEISTIPHHKFDNWHNTKEQVINNNIQHLGEITNSSQQTTQKEPDKSSPVTNTEPAGFQLDESMLELFSLEADTQTKLINEKLLELESDSTNDDLLEPLMRASHSLKGAARMIGFDQVVDIAHSMEDCFVRCQKGILKLDKNSIDIMLYSNDILGLIATTSPNDLASWLSLNADTIEHAVQALTDIANGKTVVLDTLDQIQSNSVDSTQTTASKSDSTSTNRTQDSAIRVQSDRLNKIMGISNEILVSQKWNQTHIESLQLVKKRQTELALAMERLKQELEEIEIPDTQYATLLEASQKAEICRQGLIHELNQADEFDRRSYILSTKLNQEIIASRMRPFRDGSHGFQRMSRDISHDLGKNIELHLDGLDTLIDSDILDMVEAPLTHLIRNAIDHGIELPEDRLSKGKSETGNITVHAYHHAGNLIISIVDDGKGVDLDALKTKIITRKHVNEEMANKLSEAEILDFLFLPGFSTREDVTEYSGRGVGLDVVHNVVTDLRGQIRCKSKIDQGLSVELQLPLTLSVLQTLLTNVADEYYAFPLARIHTILKIEPDEIFSLENKQFIRFNDQDISLIETSQILGYNHHHNQASDLLNIVILTKNNEYFALVVDSIIGRHELALHTIDSRLGKIKDISASAIADDGSPVLILDIDDIFITIKDLIDTRQLGNINDRTHVQTARTTKKILVIDDSLTVREVEKKLLESRGYEVDIAVDGADGWNTVRNKQYDMVITDIDMPRMNGIELVRLIKQDNLLNKIPIMIVSYKDNPDDRQSGLEAGADYYLTKGSFHDDSLLDAVVDLIGEAQE